MSTFAVGVMKFEDRVGREIDRMMGRLPALDKSIQSRFPGAQQEMGEVMTRMARQYVQVDSGAARAGIGYRVANGRLYFGIKGVDYAAALEFGFKGPELVRSRKTIALGLEFRRSRKLLYSRQSIVERVFQDSFIRNQNKPPRPFLFRAFFDSYRAMYGIMNRIIGEAQKEVGFDG